MPSFVVNSGCGLHAVWLLREPSRDKARLGARIRWDGAKLMVLVPTGRAPKRRPPCLQEKHLRLLKLALIVEGRAWMHWRLYHQRHTLSAWCTGCATQMRRYPWQDAAGLRCPECARRLLADDPVALEILDRINAKNLGRVPEGGAWWTHEGTP